jgi:hypothetical protein
MIPTELRTKDDCAVEGQQLFARPTNKIYVLTFDSTLSQLYRLLFSTANFPIK